MTKHGLNRLNSTITRLFGAVNALFGPHGRYGVQ